MSVHATHSNVAALKLNQLRAEPEAPETEIPVEAEEAISPIGPTELTNEPPAPPPEPTPIDGENSPQEIVQPEGEETFPLTLGQKFVRGFSFTLGGGYTLGGENFGPYIDTFPEWSEDAAHHRGGGIFAQPAWRKAFSAPVSVHVGADVGMHWLREKPPTTGGGFQSSLNLFSAGVLVGTNIGKRFGIGANFILGGIQLRSDGLDIGSPLPEDGMPPDTRDWTLNLGGQLYFQLFNGGIKIGADVRGQPLNISVTDNGEGLPTNARIPFSPTTFFAGFDVFRFFDGE